MLYEKIIRVISGSGFKYHTDPLCTELAFIKFVDFDKYLIGKYMFRFHIGDVPHNFDGHFF